jgi:hypothetical protein
MQRMMHLSWVTTMALTTLFASPTAAEPSIIYQRAENGGTNVSGSSNIVVVVKDNKRIYGVTPQYLAKVIRKVIEEERRLGAANEAFLKAQIADLERTAAEQQELLAAKNQELLEKDETLRRAIEKEIVRVEQAQGPVSELPPELRLKAERAIDEVNLDYVEQLLRDERESTQREKFDHGGMFGGMAWQRGQGPGGWALGLRLNGTATPALGAGGALSLRGVGNAEVLGGKVALEGGSDWRFSFAMLIGPRVRIGRRHGLLIDAYYYAPVVVREAGRWSFPLVGVGTSIGYHFWRFNYLNVIAQFATTRSIYDDGHDTLVLGVGFGYYGMR